MDSGEAAVAFDDEAHGEGNVAVGRGGLVGHDELEAGVDSVGCVGGGYYLLVMQFEALLEA
jgi:hypothetical protein